MAPFWRADGGVLISKSRQYMTESTIGGAMEILELERRLSELSTSERRYRDEAPFDWSILTERVEVDGRSVRKIGQIGAEYAQVGMPAGLMMRRNSRFNAVPEHVHDYVEISYVYRGRCPQTVAGEELVLECNEVLLLDAACPHAVAALGEDDIMLSMTVSRAFLRRSLEASLSRESAVSRFLFNALNSETDHCGHVRFRCGESRRVRRYMQEMLCERYEPGPNSAEIVLRLFQLLLAELMDCYERELVHGAAGRDESGRAASLVTGILGYIERSFAVCSLEEMAAHFHVSPNYASALLKQHVGKTYRQLVQERRLARAAELLRAGATAEAAARFVGYENMSFFYRKFRAAYGCTPATFRGRAT